jgi:hypothetical protein
MTKLSPEETLLLLSCRPILTAADEARLARLLGPGLDWALILWRAETYQTLPVLRDHVERLGLAPAVPDFVRAYLDNWTAISRARSVEQYRELGRLVGLFEEMGVDHYVMKGAAIAALAYPDPLNRAMQDLDVMIRPHDARRVQRAIYGVGYRHGVFDPATGRFHHMFRRITRRALAEKHALHSVTKVIKVPDPCPRHLVPPEWRKRQLKSAFNGDGTLSVPVFVDLHVALSPGMDAEDFWRGADTRALLGRPVRVQSVTTMVWFSAARLYREAFEHRTIKLQMLGDIDALVRTRGTEIDWSEILFLADKYDLKAPLFYVLGQAAQLCRTPVPAPVLAALAPSSRQKPDANDWGDIAPHLLGHTIVNRFEMA